MTIFVIVLVLLAMLATGCSSADFDSLAEGDCVQGNPRVEGALRALDCSDFDSSQGNHFIVKAVFETANLNADCPLASMGVADGDRVVCFGKY